MAPTIQTLVYAPGACVEYVIRDNVVVYCGISDHRRLQPEANTTNAAADIMRAIAAAHGQPVGEIVFFEFVTSTSWILKPGEYDFRLVEWSRSRRSESVTWRQTKAVPKEIFEAFQRHIGGKEAYWYEPDAGVVFDE
jgi:hypothetical protein